MRKRETILKVLLVVFFTCLCLIVRRPFYAIALAAFKPGKEQIRQGLNLDIDCSSMSFDNSSYLFTGDHSYCLWFGNSVLLTVLQVTITRWVSAAVDYGLGT